MNGSVDRISSQEFWANKNGIRLWVNRKYREGTAGQRPILFLVHGSSYSAKTMFDLQVEGRDDYSMMDHFVRLGYEVWTMDHEGYGHSDRTDGYSDIEAGVVDLKLAMDIVVRETGQSTAVFFGQSSGALRAARFANFYPDHVSKLIVDAFVWTGKDAPTLIKRAKMLPQLLQSNVRKVDAAFYQSVFTRDHAGASEAMISDIVTREELQYGDTVPNGTYLDMVSKLPVVDPDKVVCPVLMIRAEHDGIASEEDLLGFYSRLPHPDKTITKIAGLAHAALLGVNRHRLYHAVHSFMTMPGRIDIGAH
jgi:pimeloyl-ACP methyl ester carboxylesterase